MKFKIKEFIERFMPALVLCIGIILIREQDYIVELIAGIILIILSILLFIVESLEFEIKSKSKLEKAEEKAIKYKYKLEDKIIKQNLKEYKQLKKEIFKCIVKGVSAISLSSHTESISTIRDRLSCDKDFRGLCFTVYGSKIYWERKINYND